MSDPRILSVLVPAVGGQGGGVLSEWIVDAGLLRDDSWQWVPRAYCEIEYRPGEPMSLRLEITEVQTND